MIPYLLDAAVAGVDLYSNSPGRDLLSLDSFDEGPVSSEKKKPDHSSLEHPAVDQPPGERRSPPVAKKRKAYATSRLWERMGVSTVPSCLVLI